MSYCYLSLLVIIETKLDWTKWGPISVSVHTYDLWWDHGYSKISKHVHIAYLWIVVYGFCLFTSLFFLCFSHYIYSVDFEVWSKLSKCARIKRHCVKISRRFWLRLAACKRIFPLRLSDTSTTSANYLLLRYTKDKVPVLVVMECKCASVLYLRELIF